MDTDARERIPNQVFNYVMDVVEFKQKKPGWGAKPWRNKGLRSSL